MKHSRLVVSMGSCPQALQRLEDFLPLAARYAGLSCYFIKQIGSGPDAASFGKPALASPHG
jgi:hypothetical protein